MEKDSLGRIKYRDVTPEENANRHNYKKSDNMGYLDEESYQNDEQKYDYGTATLINNKARVYKGGSWNDRTVFGILNTDTETIPPINIKKPHKFCVAFFIAD